MDDEELDEVLKEAPPKQRKAIERLMISSFHMRSVSTPESIVMKKITPEHISKYLESADTDMQVAGGIGGYGLGKNKQDN